MLSRSKPMNEHNKEISWQWDDWDIEEKNIKNVNEKINWIAFCKMHIYYKELSIEATSTRFEIFSKGPCNIYDTNIMACIC